MKTIYFFMLTVFAVGVSSIAAQQMEMALEFDGVDTNGFQANLTLGWSFEVTHPIKVHSLAFYDHFESDEDGLAFDHQVRIWTDGQSAQLMATSLITNDSSPINSIAENGRWLANPIMPVVLLPGSYVIGADDPACPGTVCDRFRLIATEFTIPEIVFGEARSASPPGPPLSPNSDLNGGYFGPSFGADRVIIGDLNGDSVVDLLDVAPFVEALSGSGYIVEADINLDGSIDLLDVGPFVDLLSGN